MKIKRGEIEGPLGQYLENLAIRGLMGLLLALPYKTRVRLMGWVLENIVAPLAGYDKRVIENLALVRPDIAPKEAKRISRAVTNNAGRSLMEIYSGQDFIDHVRDTEMTGPGVEILQKAQQDGQRVILTTGHFGNYDAPRAVLCAQGLELGSLYKPMKNAFYNAHYVEAMSTIGKPMFPRGKRGLAQMLKHLKSGGAIAMLFDVFAHEGAPLTYFGKTVRTALSTAELALKYDAVLIPIYGIRQEDGLSFRIHVSTPVPPSSPEAMMQYLNDELEELTRAHMGQWFWIHRRWKKPQA